MPTHTGRKVLLITLLLLLGAYVLLPYALRFGLERLLRAQGYDQVSLTEFDIEPFAGELRLRGLHAQRGDDAPLALDEGYLNLDWLALTRRQGLLQGVAIEGLELTLQQDDDGQLILSGLPLPAQRPPQDKEAVDWGFGINRLTVSNSQLRLRLPGIDHVLKLEQLLLTDLHSWDPDNPAQLQLAAHLDQARLRIDGQLQPFAQAPLLETRLRINDLDLAQLAKDLQKQLPPKVALTHGTLQADLKLKAGLRKGQPQLSPQGTLSLSGLKLLIDDQPQGIDKLDWKGQLNWSLPDGLHNDGTLTLADISLADATRKAQIATLNWQGKIDWSNADGLQSDNALTLADIKLRDDSRSANISKLTWQGKANWSNTAGAHSDSDLTLASIKLNVDKRTADVSKLTWRGKADWSNTDGLHSDNNLILADIKLHDDNRSADISKITWQGTAGWSDAQGASADGSLQLDGLTATQPAQQLLLAKLKQLQITQLKLDAKQVLNLAGIRLDSVMALQAQDKPDSAPLLNAKQIQIGPSQFQADQGIRVGRVDLNNAKLDIERGPKGDIPLIERLRAGAPTDNRKQNTPAATRLQLAGLRLSGDSQIDFLDHSVKPLFRQRLDVDKLTLGAADSAAPDKWTPLELAGRLGEYSQLALTGQVRPFADKLNLDLKGTLKAVELPPLSSYTTGILGYYLQSGQLDSQVTLKINDNLLDGKAELVLNKLTVKAADKERLAQLTRQLSMPLDYALDMLRDRNNTITVTLPVGGDIKNPSFDLSDIINTAMANALKTAAIGYIKNAIQPYGTLITLVQYADKAATRMALKSVDFASGSAELDDASAPYLSKLDELLKNRPSLRINICGIATESDRRALSQAKPARGNGTEAAPAGPVTDDALRTLAQTRAANLKRDLVERDISPDRLFVCNPEIDPAPDAQPRADLLL